MLTAVPPDVEAERVQEFKNRTLAKVQHVRCPVHHRPPRLTFRGHRLREITISMSGCCNSLLQIANKAIAS